MAIKDEDDNAMRERRCIVSGRGLAREPARSVSSSVPRQQVVPDIAAKLPGRGIWVRCDARPRSSRRSRRNSFRERGQGKRQRPSDSGATRGSTSRRAHAGPISAWRRRAGLLLMGFDTVLRALQSDAPPALLIEASDGAGDGKRKFRRAPCARPEDPDDRVPHIGRIELGPRARECDTCSPQIRAPCGTAEFGRGTAFGLSFRCHAATRKRRMTDTDDTTKKPSGGKTLTLKKTETSTVKQSFSHGRTKAVVVEKKRIRSARRRRPRRHPKSRPPRLPPPRPHLQRHRRRAAQAAPRAGVVLRELTEEEKQRRGAAPCRRARLPKSKPASGPKKTPGTAPSKKKSWRASAMLPTSARPRRTPARPPKNEPASTPKKKPHAAIRSGTGRNDRCCRRCGCRLRCAARPPSLEEEEEETTTKKGSEGRGQDARAARRSPTTDAAAAS